MGVGVGSRVTVLGCGGLALFPGIAIVLTVLSLNFLGEWLRERYDPPPSSRQDGAAEASA